MRVQSQNNLRNRRLIWSNRAPDRDSGQLSRADADAACDDAAAHRDDLAYRDTWRDLDRDGNALSCPATDDADSDRNLPRDGSNDESDPAPNGDDQPNERSADEPAHSECADGDACPATALPDHGQSRHDG